MHALRREHRHTDGNGETEGDGSGHGTQPRGAYASAMAEIRDATTTDVPGILALHALVAAEGRWIGTEAPVDTARFARLFTEAIESDQSHLFVATEEGKVVGNLGLHPSTPGIISVGMSIDPACRGQGIGTALMSAAIAWARAQQTIHKMELEVWPHNTAALALYAKVGFAIEGRRPRHYRRRSGELWDSVVMGLVLDTTSPGSPHPDHRP
jgi:RimJ/RimL family protein N-acetyltransferase